jgi:hypothetical protein
MHSLKVNQAGQGFKIFIKLLEAPWCPVQLHWRFMLQCGHKPGLLFQAASSQPLTSSAISSICQCMVCSAGLDAVVSSHSLQIGGATTAMMGGLQHKQIMAIGSWRGGSVSPCHGGRQGWRLHTHLRGGSSLTISYLYEPSKQYNCSCLTQQKQHSLLQARIFPGSGALLHHFLEGHSMEFPLFMVAPSEGCHCG